MRVEVAGEVRWGEEPLAARLFFGGRHGATRVELASDEEGAFDGALPREGLWNVEVVAEAHGVEAEVRLDVRSGESLKIELPDTEVFGRVVDDQGRPVARARVTLAAPTGGPRPRRTGADGEFSFRAVPAETVVLSASLETAEGTLSSDVVRTPVQESVPAGSFELRLRHGTRPFHGRVVSARGPVAGARVYVAPASPGLGPPDLVPTGLDGGFTARVPERAEQLQVVVLPPGHSLQTFIVPAAEGRAASEPAVLEAHDVAGTVEVRWIDDESAALDGRLVTLLQGGRPIPNHLLVQWAQGHGEPPISGEWRLPRMALGEYTACFHRPQAVGRALEAGGSWLDALEGCASGYLGYGEPLRLELGSGR